MFEFFWPEIEDDVSARGASNLGATAAGLVGLFELGTGAYLFFWRHIPFSAIYLTIFASTAVFAILAWAIWRQFRVAALAAMALYLLSWVLDGLAHGWFSGIIIHVAITLFLISGVRGTFAARRYSNLNESTLLS
jgi:hypothetical protein